MFTAFQGMLHSCGVPQETLPHCWLLSDASQHRHRWHCRPRKHSASKLFHPETLISFLPHNSRTLCLRRWGSFFPCLSGGGPKDVKPTDIDFHGSSQAFWSFTDPSSSCTSKDLLCNFTALLPLLMQHYTLLPAHLVFWMSIHQHTSAGCVILAFLCLCLNLHVVQASSLPAPCPDSLDHRRGCFPLSHPVVKFYTATLIPAAEYMSCDTSVVQCPPELHSHPETIKSKTTLAE